MKRNFQHKDELWEHVFQETGWGITIGSRDGKTLEAMNPAFAQMHGYTREELTGRPILDVFAPGSRAGLAEQIRVAHEKGRHSFESEHIRKDGTTFPVFIEITAVKDEAGEVLYRIVHVQDITPRKKAETERDLFFAMSLDLQVISSADGYFKRVSASVTDMLGWGVEEFLARPFLDYVHPDDQAATLREVERQVISGQKVLHFENRYRHKDGSWRVLSWRSAPGDGGLMYATARDVTEQLRAEEARHRLAAIVDHSDDAIISRNIEGLVTSWNRSASRLFGYSEEEMLGQPISVLFPGHRKDEEAQLTERILRGERIQHFETVRRRKNGQEFDVSVTLSPIRDSSGAISGISKIARDISELKAIQRQLVRAKDSAEAANRELESFSYSVAHDLRAPLRSIDGFSQALLEDYLDKLDEDGRKYLRFVRESAQLMAQLIDDMLTLSRVTRHELHCTTVRLSELAHASLANLERAEPHRKVAQQIQEGLVAQGDSRLLSVLLNNLLENAWKFTSKRTEARIEFGATSKDGQTVYFVRDNGAGFDMSYANKLFGVFQRLHSAHEFEGTGVGLATVQRIVQRHRGRAWGEGIVGEGATFYFTLGEKEPHP